MPMLDRSPYTVAVSTTKPIAPTTPNFRNSTPIARIRWALPEPPGCCNWNRLQPARAAVIVCGNAPDNWATGGPMRRRTFLAAAAAGLALPAVSRGQDKKVLRFVPQANLANLDPIWTTLYVVRNASLLF